MTDEKLHEDRECEDFEGESCEKINDMQEDVSEASFCEEDGDEIEQLKNKNEELKVELATARADLYNYRQRVDRDRGKMRKLIVEDTAGEFLPVLDNLDRALSVSEDVSAKDVLMGIRMVQRQFLSVLENVDVMVIPTEGCPFDPALHDAVETEFVEDPALDGVVLQELLRGYKTSERVLRPSQVRVGKLKSQ